MKVTTSAAMRARDVSRPHAEHVASAEAAEAAVTPRPEVSPAVQAGRGAAAASDASEQPDGRRADGAASSQGRPSRESKRRLRRGRPGGGGTTSR
jgi:hypothetical protein